jgi:bifunctional non-homologous end joining protein LigD
VRPTPDARVSTPIEWDEVDTVEPQELTLATVPARVKERGDPGARIDDEAFSLERVLELSARQERDGAQDAPWPPHYAKGDTEPARVAPSRAKKPRTKTPKE